MLLYLLVLLSFYLSSSHGHTEFIYTANEEVQLDCNSSEWHISIMSESRLDTNCEMLCGHICGHTYTNLNNIDQSCTKTDSDEVGENCPLIARSGFFQCASARDSYYLYPFKPSPNTVTSYVVAHANEEMTTKSEERSSVELTEGGDVLLNCSFNLAAGYDQQAITVYWIKTIERSSSCVYSYDFEMNGVMYNHHCNVQEDLLHRLSNQTDSKTSHNIRIRTVTESDAGQYLCVLHVLRRYTEKGNWKIINNITVSLHKDKEPEISRYSSDDVESLIRLCVTLPIILVVPMAVMGVYFCRKTETSPESQVMKLQTL